MQRRAVIYTRVSTVEQAKTNLSLPTQQKTCRDYCERQGLVIDRIFTDQGASAKTADRPEFQRMLAYCRQHKGRLQHVLVFKIDRFARSALDHALTAALLKPLGITLRSATEPIDESVTGMLMENILAAFAQFDNDQRAARTIAGMQAAIEDGRWTFAPPVGYRTSIDTAGRRTIAPDPDRGPLVLRAFELLATGVYSKQQVRGLVTTEGLRTVRGAPISAQTFHKMLRNPLYTATITVPRWGQERWPGGFEPIVTTELFAQVQAVLDGKAFTVTPHKRNHPDFPLRRFVRCGSCGLPLTAAWSTGRAGRYGYYRCRNRACVRSRSRR